MVVEKLINSKAYIGVDESGHLERERLKRTAFGEGEVEENGLINYSLYL